MKKWMIWVLNLFLIMGMSVPAMAVEDPPAAVSHAPDIMEAENQEAVSPLPDEILDGKQGNGTNDLNVLPETLLGGVEETIPSDPNMLGNGAEPTQNAPETLPETVLDENGEILEDVPELSADTILDSGNTGTELNGMENGKFATAEELYQYWMGSYDGDPSKSPYPDYICGVWSTNGDESQLTFAVTKDEAGEKGKQEILDLVADDETIAFTYQSYSYSELLAVHLDLSENLGKVADSYGFGIHDMENCVVVNMNLESEEAIAFAKEYTGKYQDRIRFEAGGNFSLTIGQDDLLQTYDAGLYEETGTLTTGVTGGMGGTKSGLLYFAIAFVLALAVAAVVMVVKNRAKTAAMQTDAGTITTSQTGVRKKDVIKAVENQVYEPKEQLKADIMEKIKREQ